MSFAGATVVGDDKPPTTPVAAMSAGSKILPGALLALLIRRGEAAVDVTITSPVRCASTVSRVQTLIPLQSSPGPSEGRCRRRAG
jgi:hypothetical protein